MKRIDFENGTVTNNILSAALPMLVAQILNLLYNIVDRIYIARIHDIGTTALGAVGLCFPIIMIITAFSNLFGSGGAPIFSINRGKGDSRTADMIMNTAFTMLCGSAAVLMLIGFLFARPLLTLFGASDDALVYAYPYLMIYLLGTLPSMIATGMNPFINAQGYAIIGMLSVTVGAVANIILDPIFIFVLDMGIKGAAIATVISQILSALLIFYFLHGKSEFECATDHLSDEVADITYSNNKIVPVKDAGDHIKDPVVKEIFDAAQEASSIQLWYDQYLPTSVATAHLDGLQEVFGLTKTPKEAQEEMQKAMDEYLSTKSDSGAADDTAEEATDDAAADDAE